jgi:3-deoxy-manno-octulosonate cytidylyltransferase (CMP-KDO synthetase)
MKTLVIIPSRMSATRLPGKPLFKINDISIISTVYKKAVEANIGDVIVATEDQEIIDDVELNGGNAILTDNTHKTGTDRIFQAFERYNEKNIDLVMNLQGDEPMINIEDIKNLNDKSCSEKSNMSTLAAKIKSKEDYKNSNVVKVETYEELNNKNFPTAVNFERIINQNIENIYHHLGIYCYSVDTLQRFINLSQSEREKNSKLEQLRALDNGIKINVSLAKNTPIGVDTMEDYMAIKKILEYKN